MVARRNAYQAVKARLFTRVCGRPTWETKEHFLEEARETAMIFDQVTYDWCGEYGLLAEIEGATRYKTLTGLDYTAPVKPPPQDPDIVSAALTDKQARARQELHGVKLVNFAILEGFRLGFSENFQGCKISIIEVG